MNTSYLKSIYLFAEFTDSELSKVAAIATEKEFIAGQDIFTHGQKANSFFVVTMGTVKVATNSGSGDEIKIRNLGSGSHFGEMSFMDQEPRSATVSATESSRVIEIPYQQLTSLLESDSVLALKLYRSLARFLTKRLRSTTEDLNLLRS